MICPNCNNRVDNEYPTCPYCGAFLHEEEEQEAENVVYRVPENQSETTPSILPGVEKDGKVYVGVAVNAKLAYWLKGIPLVILTFIFMQFALYLLGEHPITFDTYKLEQLIDNIANHKGISLWGLIDFNSFTSPFRVSHIDGVGKLVYALVGGHNIEYTAGQISDMLSFTMLDEVSFLGSAVYTGNMLTSMAKYNLGMLCYILLSVVLYRLNKYTKEHLTGVLSVFRVISYLGMAFSVCNICSYTVCALIW